ncbi:hypothetical protein INT43_005254 [Umbelopsis isabellina]|uniref:Uncharacterized protein n=1 Tax=Mortierella isabellina TaxID=91625 RepID=A0A8H7PGZ9_MORIS|nr:hypothetical protein INT43_005254 [Umbelopsis isabellina]
MSEKNVEVIKDDVEDTRSLDLAEEDAYGPSPTAEDWKTMREVADSVPRSAYLVIAIEFCERFTYYGLGGPFQNYIQNPPPASYPAAQPGALGRGQQTATALTTFFQFWCYITPIIGAIIADQYLGKYRTILLFGAIYMVGLVIITATSAPSAIASGASFPGFVVGLIVVGLGTGGIKSNVSPLVAEQYQSTKPYVRTLKSGEQVIVTPQATYQKIFNMFYWGINIGGMSSIATTNLEKNIGFWSAYLLPTLMFIPALAVVVLGRNYYVRVPPRGSVFVEAFRLIRMKYKIKGGLAACKPSALKETHPELFEQATWDDVFVDELKRALKACAVFCWYPIYWLCYNQMTNNLISQAGTMWTGKVPNDILSNIDGLTLLITIPLMDRIFYPALRRMGIPMRPVFRITLGFLLASISIAYAAGVQSMIYKSPPYYDHVGEADGPNYISAAIQLPAYFFIALSEIFASITGLEYAYKKAPESMKSIVMAAYLFTTCVASILGFALVPVTVDPKLTWMYTGISAVMLVITPIFWFLHKDNDTVDVEEDAIGRDHAEKDAYHQHARAEVDYEAEIKQAGG